MKKIIYIIFAFTLSFGYAQKKDSIPNFDSDYFLKQNGDTLTIALDEVVVLPKHKFKSHIDRNYYYWFRKKVFKAYPYALMAAKRLDSLNNRLGKIKSKRKRRKYVRRVQKYVEKELTDRIKKMTRTEGRVLIKLIHRQTGKTVYQNIKELRSGFKAFWYNAQANLFRISLKQEYHPEFVNEDYLIEDVVQRAYLDGLLEKQDPKLKFNSNQVLIIKRGEVDVEKYKKMFSKKRRKRKKK